MVKPSICIALYYQCTQYAADGMKVWLFNLKMLSPCLFVLVLFHTFLVSAQYGDPEIIFTADDESVNIGYTAALKCDIKGGYLVSIQKIDERGREILRIFYSEPDVVKPPQRFSGYCDNKFYAATCTVLISNVQQTDAGLYECSAPGYGVRKTLRLHVKNDPVITFISDDKVVNVGDTLELACTVQFEDNNHVVWNHPSLGMIFFSTHPSQSPKGFSFRHDDASGTYYLKISNVQETDAGLYKCEILTFLTKDVRADVWVHVRSPPVITDNSTRSIIASTGSTTEMRCYASGYPHPTISWRRGNNELLPNGDAVYIGNSFTIFNTKKDDTGTYYCIADNGIGEGARRNISLEIELPPVISDKSTRSIIASIGSTIEMHCDASGYPHPTIIWKRENNELLPTGDAVYTGNAFTLYNITKDDRGTYYCIAENGVGEGALRNISLEVEFPPVISDNTTRSIIASAGSTIEIYCDASGYPHPTISWRRENNELLPTGDAMFTGNSFTIFNITEDDMGTYYCTADNGVGESALRNVSVKVEFPPFVTIESPRYSQELQLDQILECHVTAFPPPSIVWIKDNVQLNDSEHYQIVISPSTDELANTTTLRIITTEKWQYGFYTCKATNKLGSDEKVIEFFGAEDQLQENADEDDYTACKETCNELKRERECTELEKIDSQLKVALNILEECVKNSKNQFSAFGEYVAFKLNTYDEHVTNALQLKIAEMLFEADMNNSPGHRTAQ